MNEKPENTILLAGFEPFGEFEVNPSELIARELDGEVVAGYRIKGIVLPVVFGKSAGILERTIEEVNPRMVVGLGLAAKRNKITPERLAVNLIDADIPDNAGNQPVDEPVIPDGPPAYWSTLPVRIMVATLREKNIPASLSLSAGTFVCNHVFYRLMNYLKERPEVKAGFVHIPLLAEGNESRGELDDLNSGIRVVLERISQE